MVYFLLIKKIYLLSKLQLQHLVKQRPIAYCKGRYKYLLAPGKKTENILYMKNKRHAMVSEYQTKIF